MGCAFAPAWAADPPQKRFELTIRGGTVPAAQRLMRVQKDDQLSWHVSSDAPGEIHLHAYRVQATLQAGTPVDISFKAFATGRYRVEWHAAPARGEPAGSHPAPPLATLEVHPR